MNDAHGVQLKNDNIDHDAVAEYDDVLTVFHASPLVSVDEDGEVSPLDLSLLDREHYHLSSVFEHEVRIRVDHKICTRERFHEFLNGGGRVVHFSCYEENGIVHFEKGMGKADPITMTELKSWVQQGVLELVIVTDHSPGMKLVDVFESVPHVMYCAVHKHRRDEAALVFCEAFYKALAKLQTVQDAFLHAKETVKKSTHLSYTDFRPSTANFRLLPEGKDHGTIIFQRRDGMNKIASEATPMPRVLPAPPSLFVGRQRNVYDLIQAVVQARLIQIEGRMGGASIVKSACQYMLHRRDEFLHDIVWLPPRLGTVDALTSLCLCVFDTVVKLETPNQGELARLLDTMAKCRILLVCDTRDWACSEGAIDALMNFLDEVLDLSKDTKAIIIQDKLDSVSISASLNYIKRALDVKPLGYSSSVTLFGLLCPHIAKRTDPSVSSLHEFTTLLIPSEGYAGNDKLKMTIVNIYGLLGSGDPSRIRELAVQMTHKEYESLIQVGRLRLQLSRLYQKHVELIFPTRYSLDCHLAELSNAIEDSRKRNRLNDVQVLEAKYTEASSRRKEQSSVDVMLAKRKAFMTDWILASLSGQADETERISREISTLENKINREREAMKNNGEDWIQRIYSEYPSGISRRTLENRYLVMEHLLFDARKTQDFALARELVFPLKELREVREFLLNRNEWLQRLYELNQQIKSAESDHNVDLVACLNNQVEEIEKRLADEDGEVDVTRVAEDLFIPLNAFLRFTGDSMYADIPSFDTLTSRVAADECLELIMKKARSSGEALGTEQYNALYCLYKELCGIIIATFPSIETLLIERVGLYLEMSLVASEDKDVVNDFKTKIKRVEEQVIRERKLRGPVEYFGVCKNIYFRGITRCLADWRILQLKNSLEEARDIKDVFAIAELELKIAELQKHCLFLPTASEIGNLIENTTLGIEQLSNRTGTDTKKALMLRGLQDLQRRQDAERNTNSRDEKDIAYELMIPVYEYFHPPQIDSSSDLNYENEDEISEDSDKDSQLSTVDEISDEGDINCFQNNLSTG